MPRLDPPMKWSWVEPSSCRGTHPQPPRAKPFTGFVPRAPSCAQEVPRRRLVVGWDTLVAVWWVARDMFRRHRREGCRAGQALHAPGWQGAAVGRFGSNAPPPPSKKHGAWDTLWPEVIGEKDALGPWWAAPRAWWGAAVGRLGSNLWALHDADGSTPREAESGWTAPGCFNSWPQGAYVRQR